MPKKDIKAMLEFILSQNNEEGKNYYEQAVVGLVESACKGNPKSFEIMLKILGEMPTSNSASDNIPASFNLFN